MRLEDLQRGHRIEGVIPGESVVVEFIDWHGADSVSLAYRMRGGGLRERVLYRSDEAVLSMAARPSRSFDADPADFRLAAEAQRLGLAGLFDPMLAVATSDVQPLPHQIRAVYGELLPRTPLRFLLADDPGAGKTIMAGLYIKELILRDDVHRCLIVAPGGLVEQWQDELFLKFGLHFELLTTPMIDATVGVTPFDSHPRLIARMDQVARNESLLSQLGDADWDLVVVDEAHRMGAHYFGNKLNKTKRYQLGELLGQRARHLPLMTATPHSGKEEDYQLFLSLLDRDLFEGKYRAGVHTIDTREIMRRMVKEDLLTFEGRPLFPERVAQTVPYELTAAEADLYEQVTTYVRTEMNRAEKLNDKRRNTVGFALTVLQRRLASSPEAIYQSLLRRSARLERRRAELVSGSSTALAELVALDLDPDSEDYSAEELESVEEELVDSATTAQTLAELDAELVALQALIVVAREVRSSRTDRKWNELRGLLTDHALLRNERGEPRKLIIFTEHRDTLAYLSDRIRTLVGRPEAVEMIHGGVRRPERRRITEEFTKNPACQILVATDAAGEGLNLQAAHLMVNYDLPWNPNRIEQRFGRIHRIGQTEVCRLWNLVASNTREGEVFNQLLDKIAEQRAAYGGKVFDVLGSAFDEAPLRVLLMEAIRYGEQPEVRARMRRVIDEQVAEGCKELMEERALARENLTDSDVERMRRQMDEARSRRLQPHYIEWAFRTAFGRLGGRIAKRETGRWEISHVPPAVRTHQPLAGALPVASRYQRVTFEIERVGKDTGSRADLLAPGHPLHDAVIAETGRSLGAALERGAVLVSPTAERVQVLVGVLEEIVDATETYVSRRFRYALIDEQGTVTDAGPAPYLDWVSPPEGFGLPANLGWLTDAETKAISWMISHQLPGYLQEVRPRRAAGLQRVRAAVSQRLTLERDRLINEAMVAADRERRQENVRESSESLMRKSNDLEARMWARLAELDRQESMSTKPPRVVAAALVLPLSMVSSGLPPDAPAREVETEEVERRGVDAVLAAERRLGRNPIEQDFWNPGFDILSEVAGGDPIRIEVKARIAGSSHFLITPNEVLYGRNAAPRYRLALVRVDPRGPEHDEVRYVADPFAGVDLGDFDVSGIRGNWAKTWARGQEPF